MMRVIAGASRDTGRGYMVVGYGASWVCATTGRDEPATFCCCLSILATL